MSTYVLHLNFIEINSLIFLVYLVL